MQEGQQVDSKVSNNIAIKRLRKRYLIAISLIATLVILSQLIMQTVLSSQAYDSNVVNVAGRQRMLSQKITKLSYYILTETSVDAVRQHRNALKKDVRRWENEHHGLIYGDKTLGLPADNSEKISLLFNEISVHYYAILSSAKRIIESNDKQTLIKNVATISRHEANFLEKMDEIVMQYASEAKGKVVFSVWIEISLMIMTLVALVLEVIFIFSPVAKSLQKSMDKLSQHKNEMQNLFAASPIAMLLVDPETLSIIQVNKKATDLIGDPFKKHNNAQLSDYLDPNYDNNKTFINKLKEASTLNEHEIAILNAQGVIYETLISVRRVNVNDTPIAAIGITNISELKKAQKELFHYASFDDMTGLLNRRAGLEFIQNAIAQVDEDHKTLSVCYIDLDGLKGVNDKYGHVEGDWLIQTAASVLLNNLKAGDAGVRLGGDEFLLVLHDSDDDAVVAFMEKIKCEFAELNKEHNKPFMLEFSFGSVLYIANQTTTADELISMADDLMYLSKQEKKHRKS